MYPPVITYMYMYNIVLSNGTNLLKPSPYKELHADLKLQQTIIVYIIQYMYLCIHVHVHLLELLNMYICCTCILRFFPMAIDSAITTK